MAHLVRISFILSIIWQIVGCNSSEKKVSELSEIKFDYGNQYDLQSFLSDSIPGPNYEDCTPTWGIFYFRVNSKGEVDKVETRSTLRKSVSDKIIHNIYQTNGFWKIPNDKTPEIHKWFIYQYFDLGGKFCQDDNYSFLLFRYSSNS